jgi:hypothetical protein
MARKTLRSWVFVLMLVALAAPGVAFAAEGEKTTGCVQFLLNCYEAAFELDGFWATVGALQICDLIYLDCVRHKVLGF